MQIYTRIRFLLVNDTLQNFHKKNWQKISFDRKIFPGENRPKMDILSV